MLFFNTNFETMS